MKFPNVLDGLNRVLRLWPVALAVIVFLVILNSTVFTVKYGTVGVVTRFDRVTGDVVKPGLHVKIPFVDRVVLYRTQKVIYETLEQGSTSNADYTDYPVDTTTSDGQQVSIRYTVRFSVNPKKATFVANNLGTESEVVEKIVKTDSRIHARSIPRKYKAIDLYSGNVEVVQEEIEEILRPLFEENGLILDEFGIRSINFQDEYVTAVEEKQIESERVKTEEYRAQQEEYKKQAKITRAEGDAEAQRLVQSTLTDAMLKKLYIDKWDGILPGVVAGDKGVILDLGSL
ncbi:prohibitin family protein [Candidatus Dojkabacteria bacterium]|nr:prohibitin family protein [Candidatus Dojkabacteria bacterium]